MKKYNVTFYYHMNLTVTVEARNEEEALSIAEIEATKESHVPELLESLVEDNRHDIELNED